MKLLQEIKSFPESKRELLEQQFGVLSAEAFFEHAIRNTRDVQKAIGVSDVELDELVHMVEGYLNPEFVKRCRQPVTKHGRGVIVD